MKKKKKAAAMVLPAVIFWSFSRMRETRVFEGVETPFQCLKDNFIRTLYFWDNGKSSSSPY